MDIYIFSNLFKNITCLLYYIHYCFWALREVRACIAREYWVIFAAS